MTAIDRRIDQLLEPGRNFVELGCGTGHVMDAIAGRYENSVGLDFNEKKIMPSNAIRRWNFIQADLNGKFPLEDEWADCILANQVVEHIYNPYHFARESYRITSAGGRVVVTTPNIRYLKHIFWILSSGYGPRTAGGNRADGEWDDGHIHYFTHQDLRQVFESVGFSRVWSRALINSPEGNWIRRVLDSMGNVWAVREFLSGCIMVVAEK